MQLMMSDFNNIVGKTVQTWKAAKHAHPDDPIVLAEAVDAFVSDALEALRVRLVATVGPASDHALTQAIAQSAVADYKRRDFTRTLPAELVMAILDHCDWNDLANAGRVNRALFECSQKLLHAQPVGTIRLSMLPHRRQKIPAYKVVRSAYASELVQPARNRARWSVVHPDGVQALRREGDEFVAAASYPTVRRMKAEPKWMYGYSHAWHPDGTHFATIGWVDNAPKVHIVAVNDDALRAVGYLPLAAAEENAQLCWCTSHSNMLAVSSVTRTQIFDLQNVGKPVCTLPAQMRVPEPGHTGSAHNPPTYCAQFPMRWSPTGPLLCTADAQGNLCLWDLTDVDNPAAVPLPALPVDDYAAVAWHPKGQMLCYATQGNVAIVQPGHTKPLYSIASKDLLVKFPGGGADRVWVQTRTTTDQIHAAWEPGGHPYLVIVRAGNALIARWDGETLTPVRWEIGGLGTGHRFRWVDGDAFEMLGSGCDPGLWRVTA